MPARLAASDAEAERQLAEFLAKYTPDIAQRAEAVCARLRTRVPGAVEMVYDNYNGLVIGFGPSERASEAVFSVVLYPRWVSLFFLHGAHLPDPQRLLRGSGSQVRHMILEDAADMDAVGVQALIDKATARAAPPFNAASQRRLVIKSVSAKQRPRRPVQRTAAQGR